MMPPPDNEAAQVEDINARLHASDEDVRAELRRRSRRSFIVSGAAAAAGYGFWRWLQTRPEIEGIRSPLRSALEFNSRLSRLLFREGALAPEYDVARAVPQFRLNGDIGLSAIDFNQWRLQVVGAARPDRYPQYNADISSWSYGLQTADEEDNSDNSDAADPAPDTKQSDSKQSQGASLNPKPVKAPPGAVPGLLLTMADIRKLPRAEMVTEFKCIEGWSEIVHWGGARMRDFIAAFPPATRSGRAFDVTAPDDIPSYIGLDTPDGEYYVGVEGEVALHPQSLLAYELNNEPLSPEHGAPLRLVTPLKYGIKQLKQIGRLTYSDTRPHDYWYEQGYDYYAGH